MVYNITSFPPGSMAGDSSCFTIIPVNDEFIESTEEFTFEANPSNVYDMIDQVSRYLFFQIIDDDGMCLL